MRFVRTVLFRCCTAPYIPDEDKGTRVARGADGKQYDVPGDMTFEEWKREFVGEGVDKTKKTVYNSSAEQLYRPVTRGASAKFNIRSDQKIAVKRVESYDDEVYISDKASIKPKALHEIKKTTDNALRDWNVKTKPKVVIIDESEMKTAFGKYDPVENTVYYISRIRETGIMEMAGGADSIEYHEMWHMKQADDFRGNGWKITSENRGEYIRELCARCKKNLDKLGITEDNVSGISNYANINFGIGRYDEVEAEYQIWKRRRK